MEIREGLTFDDVLLQPQASDILPADRGAARHCDGADRWYRRYSPQSLD